MSSYSIDRLLNQMVEFFKADNPQTFVVLVAIAIAISMFALRATGLKKG